MATLDDVARMAAGLPKVSAGALRDAITDGWLACAPPALARRFER
jgi:hypothetical protein